MAFAPDIGLGTASDTIVTDGEIRGEVDQGHANGNAIVGTVVVLLAAGLISTTDVWPFNNRYCWGAWEEGDKPTFLGEDAFRYDAQRNRNSRETAPTSERPRGRCVVAVHSERSGDRVQKDEVSVTYGPGPKSATKRVKWIRDHLGGNAMPMPDGLPGVVSGEQGLLALPRKCDTRDGRPTVVTLDAKARTVWNESSPTSADTGLDGVRSVAQLLVSAANHGMEAAGCAPAKPYRLTSPVYELAETEKNYGARCRIPGMKFDRDVETDLEDQVGAVTDDLQSCSMEMRLGSNRFRYLDALMVAQPRLAALFDGITGSKAPAEGWRGKGVFAKKHRIVRAPCEGRLVTFLMLSDANKISEANFAAFANAVAGRLDCRPVTSGSATDD